MKLPPMHHSTVIAIALAVVAVPAGAAELQLSEHRSDDTLLRIGPFTFEGGKTLNLTVGIGSGAFRHPKDPPNVIWTMGDRGPNIACSDMKKIAGVELPACKEVKNGRVYPTPSYAPVDLSGDAAGRRHVPHHRRDHVEGSRRASAERAAQSAQDRGHRNAARRTRQAAAHDVNGIDAEGLVRLSDGTFWIGEENGPSIAHFSADGRMIERHVPKGTEGEFAGAHYDVKGTLPAILTKRPINRGIEGLRGLARRAVPLFHHAEPARQPG